MLKVSNEHNLQIIKHEKKHYRVHGAEQHHKPIFDNEVHVIFTHAFTAFHAHLVVNDGILIFLNDILFGMAEVQFNLVPDQKCDEDHEQWDWPVLPAVAEFLVCICVLKVYFVIDAGTLVVPLFNDGDV